MQLSQIIRFVPMFKLTPRYLRTSVRFEMRSMRPSNYQPSQILAIKTPKLDFFGH